MSVASLRERICASKESADNAFDMFVAKSAVCELGQELSTRDRINCILEKIKMDRNEPTTPAFVLTPRQPSVSQLSV